MLHLMFQSIIEPAVIQRIGCEDDVVFLENSVFRSYKNNILAPDLVKMLNNNIHLYVLIDQIETRGINKNELVSGIRVIDYLGLAQLTEKNQVIMSWS